MKYYEVTTRFFDSGKVTAAVAEIESEDCPESTYAETSRCDIYRDYFVDKAEADEFAAEALLS